MSCGCHQAAGALIDAAGDDTYVTRSRHTAHAFTWDEATGLLLDEAGDDTYAGWGNTCGAAAMNGWSVFVDRAGNDTYPSPPPAKAGPNFYHGGSSWGVFIDAGGGDDSYGKRANDAIHTAPHDSVFMDLPATVDQALRHDAYRELMARDATAAP